jgi:hypothetical protein
MNDNNIRNLQHYRPQIEDRPPSYFTQISMTTPIAHRTRLEKRL